MVKVKNTFWMVLFMRECIKMERKTVMVRFKLQSLGKYLLFNDSSYEGNFKDDKMHGYVIYCFNR